MKPKKVLSIIMALLMALTMLPSLVFAAEVPSGELGGRLKFKGKAAVGCELSADYERVTPAGMNDDYVTFQWSRKAGEGADEALTEVGTEKTYILAPEDLGCRIVLKITGLEELGITGSLKANTVPVAATTEEAPEDATEKTEEEKAAEGLIVPDEVIAEEPEALEEETVLPEEEGLNEIPQQEPAPSQEEPEVIENPDILENLEGTENLETPENQEALENQESPEALEGEGMIPEALPEDPAQGTGDEGTGIETDDSVLNIGTTEMLNLPEGGTETPVEESSVSYSAQAVAEDGENVLNFGTLEEGFEEAPETKIVTITNTGTGTLHFQEIAPENFMVADIKEPLEAGESVNVWIQPRVGVKEGTYEDTINYTTEENVTVSVDALLSVSAPAPEYPQPTVDVPGAETEGINGENIQVEPDKQGADTPVMDPNAVVDPSVNPNAGETPSVNPNAGGDPSAEPGAGGTPPVEPGSGTQTADPQTPAGGEGGEVTPPVFNVTTDVTTVVDFGTVIEGYDETVRPSAQTVKLTNNDATSPVKVTVTVENGEAFELSRQDGAAELTGVEILASGTLALVIRPKAGLAAGEYKPVIKVAPVGESADLTKAISVSAAFVVTPATRNVTAAPAVLDFGTLETGYAVPPAQNITLTNSGNSPAKVTVQANACFDILNEAMAAAAEVVVPANNGTAVLKVQPKAGLGAAAYTDKPVVLTAEGAAQPLTIATAFTVKAPDTFGIVLSLSGKDFGTAEAGYAQAPSPETVTVTNTGSTTITLVQPSAKNFEIGALSAATLAPGAAASFTIRPKTGLAESVYEEDILVSSEKSQASVKAVFTVKKAAVKLTGINKPSEITGLKNGTKKNAEALGLPETVVIKTTDGNKKAKVKWDVKGSSYESGSTDGQTFSVKGTVTLPSGVTNPDGISLITSVKVSVNGRSAIVADPAGNTISGISSSEAYTTETKITITAAGAGMDNTAPGKGDTRYVPANWKVLETRVWETAPYSATFRMGKGGNYTLSVTFNQQKYDGSSWVNTGAQDVRQVGFTVADVTGQSLTPTADRTDAATKTAVQTGDSTPIMTFVIILIVAVICIVGIVVYRKKRK